MPRQRRFDVNRIGKYEVTGEIGEGGFGRVVKAWDPTIRRKVAIKLLKTVDDASLLDRFRAEAATTANLHHPNVVTLHEFGEHEGAPYIVMEYLEGKDLRELIHAGEYIPLSGKVRLLSQAAQGLQAAHAQGIFHRDIKPANIMLLQDGSAKIMDFGIARLAGERSTRLTKVGFQIGTLYYMAPEQFSGHDADVMTDVFSFGVTMYEFLSGQYPFTGETDITLMYQIVNETPRPLDNLVPNCPGSLVEVVARAIHRDRTQRYATMEDLELDLRPILTELDRADAAQLLTRIPVLLSQDKLEEAETILRRSLLMDPSNLEAKTLRERIRQRKQSGVVEAKVRELVASATHHQEQGAFAEALSCLEEARKLLPKDTDLGRRLEQAREAAQAKESSAQLYRTAQRLIEQKEFQAAREQVELAAAQDPKNGPATELLNWLRQEQDEERRAVAVQEQIALAQAHARQDDYESAIRVLEAANSEYPGTPAIESLLATIRADQNEAARQHMLRVGFERVDALIAAGDFVEARTALNRILERFPNDLLAQRKLRDLNAQVRAKTIPETALLPTPADAPQLSHYRGAMKRLEADPNGPEGGALSGVVAIPPTPVPPRLPLPPPSVAASAPPVAKKLPPMFLAGAAVLAVVVVLGAWWAFSGKSTGGVEKAQWHAAPESLSFRARSGNRSTQTQVLRIEAQTGGATPQPRLDPPVSWLRLGEWDAGTGDLRVDSDPEAAGEGLHSTSIVVSAGAGDTEGAARIPVKLLVEASAVQQTVQTGGTKQTGTTKTSSGGQGKVEHKAKSEQGSSQPPPPPIETGAVQQAAAGGSTKTETDPPGPAGRYLGNPVGSITWTGELPAGATLVLEQERVGQGPGRMNGALPGVAVRFRRTIPGPDRVAIDESPSASNRFSRVRLRNSSSESVSFILLEWVVIE